MLTSARRSWIIAIVLTTAFLAGSCAGEGGNEQVRAEGGASDSVVDAEVHREALAEISREFGHEPTSNELDSVRIAEVTVSPETLRETFPAGFEAATDADLADVVSVGVLYSSDGAFVPPRRPPGADETARLAGDTLVVISSGATVFQSRSIVDSSDADALLDLASAD